MSQVFLSYASDDRDRAKRLADAMQHQGYRVWWDRQIAPGQTFDEVIENALDQSACVVVLWSSTSIKSQWVKTEAAEAASRRILVPVRIDNVKIPLEFRRLQAADLTQWNGDIESPEFQQFLRAVDKEILEYQQALSEAPTMHGGSVSRIAGPGPSPQAVVDRGSVPERQSPAVAPESHTVSRPSAVPRWVWIAASLAVVLLIGASMGWVMYGRNPQAPDVVGMSYEQAVAVLTAAGLSAERREQPSADVPGRILAQSPSARATVASGTAVSLTVAVALPSATDDTAPGEPSGPAPAPVVTLATIPDLRGQTAERATALLAAADLSIGATTEVAANDVVLGTIVDQDPAASQTIAKGSPVRISVVTRRSTPELTGLDLQQAREALTKLGLAQRVEPVRAGRREPDNRVVRQSPAAGSAIGAGDEVALTVAFVAPKRVDGGDPQLWTVRPKVPERCRKVCQDIGLEWTKEWNGDGNTCTCDLAR